MTVLALVSAKGSPGVTLTSLALTLVWPHRVVLVEHDPAGGDLLAGFLAGADPPGGGLLGLALASRRAPLEAGSVLERTLPLDTSGNRRALPAPADSSQWRPIAEAGDRLADLFATVAADGSGPDVLLDAGRVGPTHGNPVFDQADLRLLVLRPTLRGASAARSHITALKGVDASGGVGLLLVGDGAYTAREISDALGLPVLGVIANDPVSAAVLAGERVAGRGFDRSPLIRSARSLSHELLQHLSASDPGTAHSADAPVPEETASAVQIPAGRLG